ncbi:type II secretion system protein GspM [Acinetobacter lwoffii]|jgi:type II secretory pathway component PulM|uniref:General secretion pathway protein M n=3 Tax=Acinetobacter lwoffii TaxID=28090 RepID=A0A2K8USB4_ACILW|nr:MULTISPECIES: type II secretion system protein GspM [Pseudomonadota]ODN55296.1 type II secretion system protein M [Acinetobacter sp. 51m]RDC52018.1 type II secretion system protein M [Acinetobacter sp. RIT592]HAY5569158.1 type II secretion system protein M [Escherichia coli]AUC08142.1 type II secretion system protein M [Acinetobacter lwoffii]EEY90031.1 putative phage holin, LL-H family [Acinetobacter lwoffii SH145]
MKGIEALQNRMDQSFEKLSDYLDSLSVRERVMVIFTTVFVIVAAVGSALWYMHQAADTQQKRLNQLKDTIVWMQSNAVTMKPAGDTQLDAAEKVQRVAQQQGLSVASQQMEGKIQLAVMHENYAVLANFLTQLAQMGLSIEKMELNNEAGQIKLTATIQ